MRANEGVASRLLLDVDIDAEQVRRAVGGTVGATRPAPQARQHLRRGSPVTRVAVSRALGAATLGAGTLIGWAIWQ